MTFQPFHLVIAGRDTTAQTLSWCFWEIAQNPEVYRKLREEAIAVCGDGPASYEKLKDLKYATAVFNETLRIHPNVPNSQKLALEDCVLPGTGVKVYAGQRVQWSSYGSFCRGRVVWWPETDISFSSLQSWDTIRLSGELTATNSSPRGGSMRREA